MNTFEKGRLNQNPDWDPLDQTGEQAEARKLLKGMGWAVDLNMIFNPKGEFQGWLEQDGVVRSKPIFQTTFPNREEQSYE